MSACVLGIYGLAKKKAVHDNAVPIVLLLNVTTSALLYAPIVLLSGLVPETMQQSPFYVAPMPAATHGLVFLKSSLVGLSWILAFFALKHLPLSIAAPVRGISPIWTISIAVLFLNERPGLLQWLGVTVILGSFSAFSRTGKKEGIHFRKNRWVVMMVAATLLGSSSALVDKHLLQNVGLSVQNLQAWFSLYLVLTMLPLAVHWAIFQRKKSPFEFRWSIPAIALTLLLADYLYFTAVSHPEALISLISPLRRTSVIIPFIYGIVRLSEKNWKPKLTSLLVMLLGVFLIGWGRQPSRINPADPSVDHTTDVDIGADRGYSRKAVTSPGVGHSPSMPER